MSYSEASFTSTAEHRRSVEDFLSRFQDTEVLFYPNPGNAGDSLIAAGTYAAFQRAGVKVRTINTSQDVENKVVFVGGGGNLIPLYSEMRSAVVKFLHPAKRLIILPHTIRGNEDVISDFDQNVTVFCRDKESYDHVMRHSKSSEVILSHDMAFHLNAHEFLADAKIFSLAKPLYERFLCHHGWSEDEIRQRPIMKLNRVDGEARARNQATDADISGDFHFGVEPGSYEPTTWCFLKFISST